MLRGWLKAGGGARTQTAATEAAGAAAAVTALAATAAGTLGVSHQIKVVTYNVLADKYARGG
eukprot:364819-Chlamydomonas_euryale.AAC.2